MPRTKRLLFENSVCHLMGRGNNRQQLFHSDGDYRVFLRVISEAKEKFPFLLYHYVLMPNHFHFLCHVLNPRDLSRALKKLLQDYSLYFRRKFSYVGHVWQGRYKSILMDQDKDLLACGRYIELNPIRAGLASHPAEYLWSSYRFYTMGKGDSPHLSIVDMNPVYSSFGDSSQKRQHMYDQWTSDAEKSIHLENKLGLHPALRLGRPRKKEIGTVPFLGRSTWF